MAEESIRRETAKHVSDTFNSAPSNCCSGIGFHSHDCILRAEGALNTLDVVEPRIRELEAAHAKEVMLHAVTTFELQECREAITAAILLAECGEVPAPVTVQRWGKLLRPSA